jgi:phospholipid/cholesterol/gamma-HCH transport system ATP-binding protein
LGEEKKELPKIRIRDLHKSFGDQHVLKGLNLDIPEAQTTVILGPSGAGKSVVLKHIIGLMKPDKGEILVDGMDITKMNERELNRIRRKFGMLFQGAALFDSMTVEENVAFPLREHTKLSDKEIRELVREKLHQVGLVGIENKMPSELSGGMKKRVGFVRAIILEPEILLFDEPTTGLDPIMVEVIDKLIMDTQKEYKFTNVVISHGIHTAFWIGHKIAMIYDGVIVEEGPPEKIEKSQNPIVRQFITGSIEGPIKIK